jgi:hypothetical protein
MAVEKIFQGRAQLRQMTKANLSKITSGQKKKPLTGMRLAMPSSNGYRIRWE